MSNEYCAEQAADYLGVSRRTFDTYVKNEWIEDGIKESGKTKYWLRGDLDRWKQEIAKKTQS